MRSTLVALALAGSVAACGVAPPAPEPVVRTVRVAVEVPVPCLRQALERPRLVTEADILALDNYDAAFELWADWDRRGAYIEMLEAALAPCAQKR